MEKEIKSKNMLKNIIWLYKKYVKVRKRIIVYLLGTFFGALLKPFLATIIGTIAVYLLANNFDAPKYLLIMGIISIITFIVEIIYYYSSQFLSVENTRVRTGDFWCELSLKAIRTDYENVEAKSKREKLNNGFTALDSNWVGIEGMLKNTPLIFINLVGVIIYGVIVGLKMPIIILIMTLMSVVYLLLSLYSESVVESNKKVLNDTYRETNYITNFAKDDKNGKDIRVYQMESWLKKLFFNKKKKRIKATTKIIKTTYIGAFSNNIFAIVRDVLAYLFLINMIVNKEIDLATFTFYLGLISGFSLWVNGFIEALGKMLRCNVQVNDYKKALNVKDFFNHGESKVDINKIARPISIEFKNVSYKYTNDGDYVIKDLSFKINPGEKIALVGNNGAGKTTIIKLLTGLYYPLEGEILINGINIYDFNIDDYYKLLSVAFQDSNLLAYTVRQNVTCEEKNDVDYERLKEALEKADLYEKIESLPNKEESFVTQILNDKGVKFSGGEVQKLMLARALYKGAPILILDEPTAALDPLSEAKMYEKYNSMCEGNTSVFISHRLASTKFCNRIFFLENGKIIEEGTHDELLNKGGKYSEMYLIQSKYYLNGGANNE